MLFEGIDQETAKVKLKHLLCSEDGKYVMKYLHNIYTYSPVAIATISPNHAFFREGQNSIIKFFHEVQRSLDKE